LLDLSPISVDSQSPRILVIDDSEDIRELFQLALEGAGCRVKVAADGHQGLQAMRESRPDLVIADISMPGMNGFEFLVHLRSDFLPPLPPVIVRSGFDVTAEEALRLGAVRFVAKPVEAASLIRIVEQVLRGEPADETTLEREREFVWAARARAAAAAARLFSTFQALAPELDRVLPATAQWFSDYFGFATAGIMFVDNNRVRVAGVSSGSVVPVGTTFSGRMLFSTGVLAAGSSLVVTDATDFFGASIVADPRAKALGAKFFVAVPLLYEEVPVGAIVLSDHAPHPFEAEDLLILEGFGRAAAQGLGDGPTIGRNLGFVPPPLFERMLGAELSVLHRQRGGLEVLLVEMEPTAMRSELAVEILRHAGPRLAICRHDAGTLALYKRDPNAGVATSAISAALRTLIATGTVRATGWISIVGDELPPLSHDVVLRLAWLALDESRVSPGGRVERLELGHKAMPEGLAAPSTAQ
jgi:CheY-like chemotaxis protein